MVVFLRRGAKTRVVVALNKADKLDEADRAQRLRSAQERGWEAVLVSAAKGTGLDALGATLRHGSDQAEL